MGKHAWKLLAVGAGGAVTALAFPLPGFLQGLEGAGVVWIGLVPLLLVCSFCSARAAGGYGFGFGAAFFGISLSWLTALRHSWGYTPLAVMAWVLLAAYCAIYPALFAWSWAFCRERLADSLSLRDRVFLIVLAPVLWVATEWLRGFLFTGFPWNLLGVSQYLNTGLIQIADTTGVYGVSFLIVLLNASLALTLVRYSVMGRQGPRRRVRFHAELALGLLAVVLCWVYGMRKVLNPRPSSEEGRIRVALVQPAIPQVMKWDETHVSSIVTALREQSALALSGQPDLMVWPETASPGMLRYDAESQHLVREVVTNGLYLLAGTMDLGLLASGREVYYNAAILVDTNVSYTGSYNKRHLVPFGEYLPLVRHIKALDRLSPLGFSCEPGGTDQSLLTVPTRDDRVAMGVLICFEDVFPYLSRQDVRRGARLLVNLTNDAWFDGSPALRQHLAHAVFRAVENRVPLVRSANTGISAFISSSGHLRAVPADGAADVRGFSVQPVRYVMGARDLARYTRYGDWLLAIPCVMLACILIICSWKRKKEVIL